MFEAARATLSQWNQKTTDKQKLQHAYIVLLVIVTFLAGIVALFDGERSRLLMYVSLIIITTTVTNFVAWSLLKTTLLDKLPKVTNSRTNKR